MGMTDLQFKSYLKQLIRALEAAESKDSKEDVLAEIAKLRQDLEELVKIEYPSGEAAKNIFHIRRTIIL